MIYDNCDVYIEGTLNIMPTISKHRFGEAEITISRRHRRLDDVEYYRVILKWSDAANLLNHGYLGMCLTIYGALRVRQEVEIVAEKISFIGFSNEGSFETIFDKRTDSVAINPDVSNNGLQLLH